MWLVLQVPRVRQELLVQQVRLVQQDPLELQDHKACQVWQVQMVQPALQEQLDRLVQQD
jgi:hypothetical protein